MGHKIKSMANHILIVSANFYPEITQELLSGARAELGRVSATFDEIEVPGAFEIPAAINFAIQSRKYHGYIALGCVIRGETSHYDYVCGESARGLMDLALNKNVAIGYGILTVENPQQALVRAKVSEGNKGRDAVEACLKLINIKNTFGIAK
jgi:6,7-dimethyl-8-ribityllumazine synthase